MNATAVVTVIGSAPRIIYHKSLLGTIECVLDTGGLFCYKSFVRLQYLSGILFLWRREGRYFIWVGKHSRLSCCWQYRYSSLNS